MNASDVFVMLSPHISELRKIECKICNKPDASTWVAFKKKVWSFKRECLTLAKQAYKEDDYSTAAELIKTSGYWEGRYRVFKSRRDNLFDAPFVFLPSSSGVDQSLLTGWLKEKKLNRRNQKRQNSPATNNNALGSQTAA